MPSRRVEPSTDVGEDLAYPYYVDHAGIRHLLTGLDVQLPIKQQTVERTAFEAAPQGLGARDESETTREFGEEINFAALARDIRGSVDNTRLADDVSLVPLSEDGSRTAAGRAPGEIAAEKSELLRATAVANKLVVMRGRMQQLEVDSETGRIVLILTHLSSEDVGDGYPGSGNAAEVVVPDGVAVRPPLVARGLHGLRQGSF